MMRPRKPASTAQGHNMSKEEQAKRSKIEEDLAGSKDLIDQPIFDDFLSKEDIHTIIVDVIKDESFISNKDRILISQLTDMLYGYQHATLRLENDDYFLEDGRENPAVSTQLKYQAVIQRLLNQLGMTPTARAQMAALASAATNSESVLAKLLGDDDDDD